MHVVDASILVEYLGGGEYEEAAQRVIGSAHRVWAPFLVDAEVGHALRSRVLAKKITASKGRAALGNLMGMQLHRVPHHYLVERAWELRYNASFYDALYVALAEAMDVPLLTTDRKLAGAPGLRAKIELIAPV